MPAKEAIVREIELAAIKAIRGKSSWKITEADLVRPREMGGFGLRPLTLHLQCQRAGWVADLLDNKWKEKRHYGAIRLYLSRQIFKADQSIIQKDSPLSIWTGRQQCRSTLQSSHTQWPWFGIFATQPSYEQGGKASSVWDAAVLATQKFLPSRWNLYIRAWHATVKIKDKFITHWHKTFCQKKFIDWRISDLHQYFRPRYGKPNATIATISNSYREVHISISTMRKPSWHVELQNPQISWKRVWKILGIFSREASGLENSLRLFLLGNLTTPASWASEELKKWPNNHHKSCTFCSAEPETRNHLLEGCQRVQEILVKAIGGYGDGFLRAFADKDIMDPDDMSMLYGRASAIHHIFTFIRSRRLSRIPLPAITTKDTDLLTEQISHDASPLAR